MRSDILSKLLTKHSFPNDIEGLFVEINFRKSNGYGTYYLPSQNDQYNFDCLDKALDNCCSCEKVIVTGDFNRKTDVCLIRFFINMN